jgi:hypothetical protein
VKRSNNRLDVLKKKDDTATTMRTTCTMRSRASCQGARAGQASGHLASGMCSARMHGVWPARRSRWCGLGAQGKSEAEGPPQGSRSTATSPRRPYAGSACTRHVDGLRTKDTRTSDTPSAAPRRRGLVLISCTCLRKCITSKIVNKLENLQKAKL